MAVKLDRKNFMFTDKKDETLVKKKGEVNGLNFKIRNLINCTVYLADRTNGVRIHLSSFSLMIALTARLLSLHAMDLL